jgi:hypothetical protein
MEAHPSDPPGTVSDQNEEEAESGLRHDRSHPEPRTSDADPDPERKGSGTGQSGEGSQSTGHPDNAG